MLINHPAYVAYAEIASMLKMSADEVKEKFTVSRRINRLCALVNFLYTYIDFSKNRYLLIQRHGHLVTIKLMQTNNPKYLDIWYFRCSKQDDTISDEMETYFVSKKFCLEYDFKNPGKMRARFSSFSNRHPLSWKFNQRQYVICFDLTKQMPDVFYVGIDFT